MEECWRGVKVQVHVSMAEGNINIFLLLPPPPPLPRPRTPSHIQQRVQALYDFEPQEEGELLMRKGDIVTVLEKVDQNWWKGTCGQRSGLFPAPYVKELES